jgi:hypothetical protein
MERRLCLSAQCDTFVKEYDRGSLQIFARCLFSMDIPVILYSYVYVHIIATHVNSK